MKLTVRRHSVAHGITAWKVTDGDGRIHYVTFDWRRAIDCAIERFIATEQPGTGDQVRNTVSKEVSK